MSPAERTAWVQPGQQLRRRFGHFGNVTQLEIYSQQPPPRQPFVAANRMQMGSPVQVQGHYVATASVGTYPELLADIGRVLELHRERRRHRIGLRNPRRVIFLDAQRMLDLLGTAAAQPDLQLLCLQQLLNQFVLVLEHEAGKALQNKRKIMKTG